MRGACRRPSGRRSYRTCTMRATSWLPNTGTACLNADTPGSTRLFMNPTAGETKYYDYFRWLGRLVFSLYNGGIG